MKFLWYLIKTVCGDIWDGIVDNINNIIDWFICVLLAFGVIIVIASSKTIAIILLVIVVLAGLCIIAFALFIYIYTIYDDYKHSKE